MSILLATIITFMIIMSVIPIGMFLHAKSKGSNAGIFLWKLIAFVLLFELSLIPYLYAILMSDWVGSWINLVYFILIWIVFYVIHCRFTSRTAVLMTLPLSALLMVPASLFISIVDYTIVLDYKQAINFLLDDGKLFTLYFLYKYSWAMLPLLGSHYLLRFRRVYMDPHFNATRKIEYYETL